MRFAVFLRKLKEKVPILCLTTTLSPTVEHQACKFFAKLNVSYRLHFQILKRAVSWDLMFQTKRTFSWL